MTYADALDFLRIANNTYECRAFFNVVEMFTHH